jgi:hypothetical protein
MVPDSPDPTAPRVDPPAVADPAGFCQDLRYASYAEVVRGE